MYRQPPVMAGKISCINSGCNIYWWKNR